MHEKYDYELEYEKFQNDFKLTQVSGEEVGVLIMRMSGYFMKYNLRFAEALKKYSFVKADFQGQLDPVTGKAMSSSKAEILADNTSEAAAYELARVHILNLEQHLNSLKALQRSLIQEYSRAA